MDSIIFQPFSPGLSNAAGNQFGSIDPRLSRTNYFDGQLLKASDLTRDQIYLDERLLEMGQVLGSGIISGLDVELIDNHILRVQTGSAIAPSGRVLQLSDKSLEINLQDSGFIATLNKGKYRRFNRGLYAIALNYAEVVDGISEAYPADLTSRRQMQVSSYAEGVELVLIPLNINLPRGDGLTVRAALAQQLISRGGHFDLPSDEAIALGMIAIDQMRPQWLDRNLLRRPLRRPNLSNALQLDLAAHYSELLADILNDRQSSGRRNDFSARQYFSVLPPFGPIPKQAIDPSSGRQSFFPADYEVTIAPVRREDVAAIIEESAQLAPMDLQRDADADIMVLVPMDNQAFALRARQLEKSPQLLALNISHKLPSFSGLALRLFKQPPVHLIDTDAEVWKSIWNEVDASELIYVRRPPRTAETNVSAVVLARGFSLPDPTAALPPDPASLEAQLDSALDDKDAAEKKLTVLQQEVIKLQVKIKSLQESLGADTDLNETLEKLHTVEAALKAAEQTIEKLTAETQNAASLKTALAAATDKITTLSKELEQANKKLADLQASSGTPSEETRKIIDKLSTDLKTATTEAEKLKNERDAITLRQAESEQQIKTLNAELDKRKQTLDEIKATATDNENSLSATREENSKLKKDLEAFTTVTETLKEDVRKAQEAKATAENESKNATLQLANALKLTSEAQAESAARNSELSTTKESLNTLTAKLATIEKTNAELQLQLAQSSSLRSALPLTEMAELRGGVSSRDAEKLEALIGDNDEARIAVTQILAQVDASFDKALWPTLLAVAKNPQDLPTLSKSLSTSLTRGTTIDKAMPAVVKDLGVTLSASTLRSWESTTG